MFVGSCHHVLLVDLVSPPADHRHAVFNGAGGKALAKPVFDQGLNVFGFQGLGFHFSIAQLIELIGYQAQHPLTFGLGVDGYQNPLILRVADESKAQ